MIYNPGLITIKCNYLDVDTIFNYEVVNLSLIVEYYSGYKDVFIFGSKEEVDKAVYKIEKAQGDLDYGV